MSKAKVKTYASVWDATADTPEEAVNLRTRSADAADRHAHRTKWLDSGRGSRPMRRHPAAHQRSAPRLHRPLLTRRSRQHRRQSRPQQFAVFAVQQAISMQTRACGLLKSPALAR